MISREEKKSLLRDLAKALAKIGAVRFGVFTLAGDRLSSYYIDLRLLPSYPSAFKKVIDIFVRVVEEQIGSKNVGAVAAIPMAGLIYATAIAYRLGRPLVYVRTDARRQRFIEGFLSAGTNVLLVDDLITTGASLAGATRAIRGEGGVVAEALVLIDRMEGGREQLASLDVKLHAFATVTEVADALYAMGLIDEQQQDAIYKQASTVT